MCTIFAQNDSVSYTTVKSMTAYNPVILLVTSIKRTYKIATGGTDNMQLVTEVLHNVLHIAKY